MKIDPKASQSGDTISFFSNVLYGTCLTTGRWRRSRSSGRGLSVRTMYTVYRSTTRTRMYTDRRVEAIASGKVPTKRSNAEQNSSKISVKWSINCPAKYRRKRGKILPQNIEEPRAKLVWHYLSLCSKTWHVRPRQVTLPWIWYRKILLWCDSKPYHVAARPDMLDRAQSRYPTWRDTVRDMAVKMAD